MIEFEQGEFVVVEAKDFFLGKRLANFLKACVHHDNSFEVWLVDPAAPVRLVCVHLNQGDTIVRVSRPIQA